MKVIRSLQIFTGRKKRFQPVTFIHNHREQNKSLFEFSKIFALISQRNVNTGLCELAMLIKMLLSLSKLQLLLLRP